MALALDWLERERTPIHVQADVTCHPRLVGARFLAAHRAVMISIALREDARRHRDPRRQVQLDPDAVRIDADAQRLEILVQPMCRYWLRHGDQYPHDVEQGFSPARPDFSPAR